MPTPYPYRRSLLAVVEAFLESTPASLAKAHRMVRRLEAARQFTTLDTLVWSGFISELTDSLFYQDPTYLAELRTLLLHGSPDIHRAYLRYDYRPDFTVVEGAWHEQLSRLGELLQSAPFADASVAIEEYQRYVNAIEALAAQASAPRHVGDEQVYHFILREVSATLTTIDLRHALLNVGWLIPNAPYTVFPPDWARREFDRLPDLGEQVAWARRALRALVAEGWLCLTWQVTPNHYLVALH